MVQVWILITCSPVPEASPVARGSSIEESNGELVTQRVSGPIDNKYKTEEEMNNDIREVDG